MLKTVSKKVAFGLVAMASLAALPTSALAQGKLFEEKIAAAKAEMMADSSAALGHARDAADLIGGNTPDANEARLTAKWLEAEALLRLNRADEALEIATATLDEAKRLLPKSKLHADLLRSNGSMAAVASDYGKALAFFLEAHELYNALGEKRSEAIVLQNIGSLYSDARDYERVLRYYRQATETYPGDPALSLSAHNNKGNALKELGRLEEAEEEFRLALSVAEEMGSPMLRARILNNIASVQFARGRRAAANETAAQAYAIARNDAPEWIPFIFGVRSQIALESGELRNAVSYLNRTFEGENLAETSPYFRDFHQTAYETYRQLGNFRLASEHLSAFNRLDSQARDLSAKANNAILGARFESAQREVSIARLSAEKQAKEAQLADERGRVIGLSALVGLGILMLLGGAVCSAKCRAQPCRDLRSQPKADLCGPA